MSSKKLEITTRGKALLAVAMVLVVILSFSAFKVFSNRSLESNAAEIYTHTTVNLLNTSIENDSTAKDELRTKIAESNTLISETASKVFDSSRTNLQTYIDNISDIPDSTIPESDNFIDYVKSERSTRTYIATLDEKKKALQEDYDAWTKNRTELEKSTGTIQEELEGEIESASDLEKQIQENLVQQENRAEELEKQIQEKQRNEEANKPAPAKPAPSAPVEKPAQTDPAPARPTPTQKPDQPTALPTEKPSVEPTPAPTPTKTPTSPPPEDTDNEPNADGNTTMIRQENG